MSRCIPSGLGSHWIQAGKVEAHILTVCGASWCWSSRITASGTRTLVEQPGEKVDFANDDQVAERGRVRDSDHWREALRIEAMSRSRSSIV
jgi:hypothetical protein